MLFCVYVCGSVRVPYHNRVHVGWRFANGLLVESSDNVFAQVWLGNRGDGLWHCTSGGPAEEEMSTTAHATPPTGVRDTGTARPH